MLSRRAISSKKPWEVYLESSKILKALSSLNDLMIARKCVPVSNSDKYAGSIEMKSTIP